MPKARVKEIGFNFGDGIGPSVSSVVNEACRQIEMEGGRILTLKVTYKPRRGQRSEPERMQEHSTAAEVDRAAQEAGFAPWDMARYQQEVNLDRQRAQQQAQDAANRANDLYLRGALTPGGEPIIPPSRSAGISTENREAAMREEMQRMLQRPPRPRRTTTATHPEPTPSRVATAAEVESEVRERVASLGDISASAGPAAGGSGE